MNLNKLYNIIPDEDEWTNTLNLRNKLCNILENDSRLERVSKAISVQIIDFIRQTPITSFDKKENEYRSICGLYEPSLKMAELDRTYSYGLNSSHYIDKINVEELKNNINKILSEYFSVNVINTCFSYDANNTCNIDSELHLDSCVYIEIDFLEN